MFPEHLLGAALIFGLVSSLHCVGMCGPLQFLLPFQNGRVVWTRLVYHLGRIVTYGLFGFAFGFLGLSLVVAGFQNHLVVAAGVLILLFTLVPSRFFSHSFIFYPGNKLRAKLLDRMSRARNRSFFLFGLLNGLIPCAMVYSAIAGSIGMGSPWGGALFMLVFGSGTLPLMWLISVSTQFFSGRFRNFMAKANPYLVSTVAVLLILKGLNLDIPFVSSVLSLQTGSVAPVCD